MFLSQDAKSGGDFRHDGRQKVFGHVQQCSRILLEPLLDDQKRALEYHDGIVMSLIYDRLNKGRERMVRASVMKTS